MDAQAAFRDMISAALTNDFDRAEQLAQDLLDWLDAGGRMPDLAALSERTPEEQRKLVRRTCQGYLLAAKVWRDERKENAE